MIGIYSITNLKNNKRYIGKSNNIQKRLECHKNKLKNNKHYNQHFQNSWNKYKENNFIFEILEYGCFDNKILNEKEIYWIDHYKSNNYNFGYNKTFGGDRGVMNDEIKLKVSNSLKKLYTNKTHHLKGKKLAEETKRKLSQLNKGKNNKMYGKNGPLSPSYGLIRSQEFKDNLSKKLKGHHVSLETREKIKQNRGDTSGINNPFYGKRHTIETKLKISETKKAQNKKLSEKHKQLLLSINTGRVHTDESKLKMAKARYKLSDNQVIEILKLLKKVDNLNKKELIKLMKEIGKNYNVSNKTINRIRLNETYTHIERGIYL